LSNDEYEKQKRKIQRKTSPILRIAYPQIVSVNHKSEENKAGILTLADLERTHKQFTISKTALGVI